ncbi:Pectinesterase [Colletotrichum higginsianum IMI 349063]|uniref:Pectinesterase n=1 Tax=Colletotrichum higginsianum (strain IMI 349063) TaxID=759273 RepID=A0A1B7YHB1_COLHI|nr:Pectinesterase [Colletotrichum higginsianum IMI 349063]OBR11372.1 Pectinesterase [Colletotrichum higginsianum IMI 349063]
MASVPNINQAASHPPPRDQDHQQQLKKKWKGTWLRGLSVRIRTRKDALLAAAAAVPAAGGAGGGGQDLAAGSVERGTQTTTATTTTTAAAAAVARRRSRPLRQHSETRAQSGEPETLLAGQSGPSTAAMSAATSASHSPATSTTTAQTTTVPSSSSSSSSSTSLSVGVGASIGSFPSTSSAPCPTCGQRRHIDLHRPPTPVKPEDRFQFRSGVPYGPWTITHPPPVPLDLSQTVTSSEAPTAPIDSTASSNNSSSSDNNGSGVGNISGAPLTSFHPFSRLPPELRSKILRFYLERPRIVEIRCMNDLKKIHFAPNALGNLASNIAWSADNTLPALMWVNRECRAETRAFYRVQLPMHPTNKIAWPVLINPSFDTVIFTFPWSSEIPLDIFLSDCLAFDPLGVGIRHFGTRDRGGPETWDLTPVPGCAPLSKSLANLESYTEAIQLVDDRAAARFPVWMIHEGYLTSGIPAKNAFYQDVPRLLLSNDYEPPDATNQRAALEALRAQLAEYLPRDVAQKLVMQRMFYRKYFRHLRMKCTKTDLAGLGMVRQIPGGETEEFFLSNGREVVGPRKKRRCVLDVRPSSSWHLWDDD